MNVGNSVSYSSLGGAVANAVSGLTGTATVVITLSGAAGNGQFRLDNFVLNGYIQQITTSTSVNSGKDYRYGFNGKEKDSNISSDDYDYGARIYDGKLGRWMSVDPLQKKYPAFSPYNYVENNPLVYKDVDGRDKWLVITLNDERTGQSTMISMKISDELKYEVVGQYSDGMGHGSRGEKHFSDINLNYNITIDKNGKTNVTVSENRGIFRVAVDNSPSASADEKWARKKMWLSDIIRPDPQKQADIGEGFWLTSENAKGQGDPYAPGAKKITKIDNADAFLMMLGRGVDYAEGTPMLLNELKEIPSSVPNRFLEALAAAFKTRENVSEAINMAKEKLNKVKDPQLLKETKKPVDTCPACEHRADSGHINKTVRKINERRKKEASQN
jgi:RHS repeat-associated protein